MPYTSLPSVNVVLASAPCVDAQSKFGHATAVEVIRATLADERLLIKAGHQARDAYALALLVVERLEADAISTLRPVLNLTGVVLHTNLGRALLPESAIEAAIGAMRHTLALEYNLENGKRGERDDHLRDLICELTGAEDATIVNNNAAAVLLALNSLAQNQKVIISRGEMIEIGGSFRIPDIMECAGCHLKEVGTTNRTHPHDYKIAIDEETALLLKVHTSNYKIEGFTAAVNTADLSAIAHDAGKTMMEDLGSGTLIDLSPFGLNGEPTVREAISAGADLVTFSGDKLLGGPQAGFIVGRADLIVKINKNPMKRAMRVDKIRLSALEAVLRLYRNPAELIKNSPTFVFLNRKQQEILKMAHALYEPVQAILDEDYLVEVVELESEVGSGAQPTSRLKSAGLAISALSPLVSVTSLQQSLRFLPIPIIGRIKHDRLVLDLRCAQGIDSVVDALEMFTL